VDIVRQIWDEAKEIATNKAEWHQHVAQCTHIVVVEG